MKKTSLFCLLASLLLQIVSVFGQSDETYRPSQMHADLRKFKFALEYAHPDLFAHITPTAFSSCFDSLISRSSMPVSRIQFYKEVLHLVAVLHDGHAQVFAGNRLRTHIYKKGILPFHVHIQSQRIYLTRNMSERDIADGSEIISINGESSNEILSELMRYFAGDGLCTSCLEYRFASGYQSFYRVFPLIFGFDSAYKVVVKDYKTGATQIVEVASIDDGTFRSREMKKYGNNLHVASMEEQLAQEAFRIDFPKGNQYAYLKISRFFKDDFEEPANTYPDFYLNAFRQIKEKGISNLIIDLRNNGGGIGGNAAALIQYLSDKAFVPTREISLRGNDKYYTRITKDSLELDNYFKLVEKNGRYVVTNSDSIVELQEFKPISTYAFRGNLYVLINGGTLSAAGMAAGLLRQYTNAIFIGQETGGHAGMSNGIRQLSIWGDSTDMAVNIPLLHSEFSIDNSSKKSGVIPDYIVLNSIQDIVKGKDAVLEAALQKIGAKK